MNVKFGRLVDRMTLDNYWVSKTMSTRNINFSRLLGLIKFITSQFSRKMS